MFCFQDLTYRFISLTSDMERETQKNILRKMIQKWAAVSTLTITEQNDPAVSDDDVDILIKFVRRYHGDPYAFDGQGGTLAHAYYPHNNKGWCLPGVTKLLRLQQHSYNINDNNNHSHE